MTPHAAVPAAPSSTPQKFIDAMPTIAVLAALTKLAMAALLALSLIVQRALLGVAKGAEVVPADRTAEIDRLASSLELMTGLTAVALAGVAVALLVSRRWFRARTHHRRCVAVAVLLAVPFTTNVGVISLALVALGGYAAYALLQPAVRASFSS